jgi:hypothetical protein
LGKYIGNLYNNGPYFEYPMITFSVKEEEGNRESDIKNKWNSLSKIITDKYVKRFPIGELNQ